jgi:hypothetical protein
MAVKFAPASVGAIGGSIADVDGVFIVRGHAHPGEIETAAPDAIFVVDALPALARVVRAKKTAELRRVHERVHATRIAGRDADADTGEALLVRGQSFSKWRPGVPAIH